MAWKKSKPKIEDPLAIEMDEYQLAYLFIKTKDMPEYEEIRASLEEHFAKDVFTYSCFDENEKQMIENILK